jgi:hypothetical protein
MTSSRLFSDTGLVDLDLPDLPPAIESQSTEAASLGVKSGYGDDTTTVFNVSCSLVKTGLG